MAHIYMTFDFGTDEAKAQQARHKLDGWKQAFRLDKKLLYKFERPAGDIANRTAESDVKNEDAGLKPGATTGKSDKPPKSAKAEKATKKGKAGKGAAAKAKAETETETVKKEEPVTPPGPVKLHLRLAFSGHEKMTEDRWLKRIPAEEPFKEAKPSTVREDDAGFAETEGKFESLE